MQQDVCVCMAGGDGSLMYANQQQTYVNGFLNGGVVDLSQTAVNQHLLQQQTGAVPANLIAVCESRPSFALEYMSMECG
jgi:hypothetical protein